MDSFYGGSMLDESTTRDEKRTDWLHSREEWAPTVVGLVLIVLVLAGVIPVDLLP
jgi:uncharacterized membrane protein YkvA (DUF1232 family)